ncbi:MAG: beta-ketoacyl-ACP synthase II [Actinobacteria bacterium]|nr:beta-ketoacyl-ACP synthase II [Actinomycetota bacterium]MCI0543195.1 beta-ketoacyl-ACP synthase II [Actinomycetota bacterium]MCI0677723.1 beta-ketoacyl-ACP synthase II [Actinomycetota bacterium]
MSLERHRVVVTGLGAVTPLGNDVESSWEALLKGRSGAGRITLFDPTGYRTTIAAEVDWDTTAHFDAKEARRLDRFSEFFIVAARQAITHAGLDFAADEEAAARSGVMVGAGFGGMGSFIEEIQVLETRGPDRVSPTGVPRIIPNMAAGLVSIEHNLTGPVSCVVTACSASANAIGDAAEIIRRGAADVMVAGGAEAAITTFGIATFAQSRALSTRNDDPTAASRPFDAGRDGFVMGEGGAVLVLESLEHAAARGAEVLAEVTGYGMSADAYHITLPKPGGMGAAKAMVAALQDAGLAPDAIGYINAHGTSTPANDSTETAAIKIAMGEAAATTPVSSTKSMTGHLLGGAGAVEAIFSILAIRDHILPPTINYETPDPECDLDYVPNEAREATLEHAMSNSFGFGGHNVALVISAMR